ncbi:RNA pyrophosphohydrolase [Rhodobacteraceae bacterium N5(2021)]|uniref:RNA pyrophosphohydrolase n=1 Tax=Gymnodinialimonas phycosphaerae TaxID=2841589 RepID=A0A975TTQ4_9RHOB|nr:RNA pyrophosphohydrolase [Gymnodinialimonas phycosphaerae]
MSDPLPYRPCVGVVLTNADGRIFAGQRANMDTPAWQMPQGGIDEGEDPLAAAYRELEEETGVGRDHVTFVQQTADWLAYDFPDELPMRWKEKYRGQTQMWVHFRLDAPDSVINLNHKDVEFSAWRWMTKREILTVIVPFKRAIYKAVLKEFAL